MFDERKLMMTFRLDVVVKFADPEVLQLLKQWVDQNDDRKMAIELAADVKVSSAALEAAIPK